MGAKSGRGLETRMSKGDRGERRGQSQSREWSRTRTKTLSLAYKRQNRLGTALASYCASAALRPRLLSPLPLLPLLPRLNPPLSLLLALLRPHSVSISTNFFFNA